MPDIKREAVALPTDISQEIIAKTQEESAVMRLARHIALPGRGLTIPVITEDSTAGWVAETGMKPVSNPGLNKKVMMAYKLAVIETFSEEFTRDLRALYDTLIERLPNALAVAFDKTVLGAVEKPGENFDNFASCTAQSLIPTSDASTYDALVAADTDIAIHGDGLTSLQFRKNRGEDTFETGSVEGKAPTTIYLSRRGKTIASRTGKGSLPDYDEAAVDLDLPEECYVGLFLCSHEEDVVETCHFRNVRFEKLK